MSRLKRLILYIICFAVILSNFGFVLAEDGVLNDCFKNLKADNVINVMKNTVMLRPGSSEVYAYGEKYDLYAYGETAEVRKEEDKIYAKKGFFKEVFSDLTVEDTEEIEIFEFAETNNLKVTELNGTYYISEKEYVVKSNIDEEINYFFGIYVKAGAKGKGFFDSPTAGIDRAMYIASKVKKTVGLPDDGISIYFREGYYTFADTLSFKASDSGLDGSPIRYRAYKDELVVFDGGLTVYGKEFSPITNKKVIEQIGNSKNTVVVDLNKKLEGFDQSFKSNDPALWSVYYKGEPISIARWPDKDWERTGEVLNAGGPAKTDGFVFVVGDARIKNWANEANPRIFGYFGYDWAGERVGIAEIDMNNLSIKSDQKNDYGIGANKRYYVYNMLCELDCPGEFYFDKETNELYVYPIEGDSQNPEFLANTIQFSVLSGEMIKLLGAKNISFEKIIFENTIGTSMIVDKTCKNIEIKGCTFRNINRAIDLAGFNNKIQSCDFYNIKGRPIYEIGGDRNLLKHSGNMVINNKFWNCNTVSRTNNGAINVSGVGSIIAHNEFVDCPHMALSLNGNDNIVEYNEFYNNLADEAGDAGTIYGGRQASVLGNIVRNNYFHDAYVPSIGTVYLDDLMSYQTIEGNVFENEGTGVFIHGGILNKVRDNLFLNSRSSGGNVSVGFSAASGSWKPETATSLSANTFMWRLKEMPWESAIWQDRYADFMQYIGIDENPIYMRDEVTGNISVNRSGLMNIEESHRPYVKVENNVDINGEAAKSFEIPERYKEVIEKSGVYVDEYRTSLDEMKPFDLVEPRNNEKEIEAADVYFSWQRVADAHEYQFTLALDKEFKNIISNKIVNQNNIQISNLNYFNTDYYWKVKAIANHTNSVCGVKEINCKDEYFKFTTKAFEVFSIQELEERIALCEGRMVGLTEGTAPGELKVGTIEKMNDLIEENKKNVKKQNLTKKLLKRMTNDLAAEFENLYTMKNPDIFDMQAALKTPSVWNKQPNTVEHTLEKFTFVNIGQSSMGTTDKVSPHYIFKFRAKMDGLGAGWYGFSTRAQNSPLKSAWSGNSQYLFIIKENTFEIQRWNNGSVLEEYPNTVVKNNEWYEFEVITEDRDDGTVYFAVKVDGNIVADYIDEGDTVKGPGYFQVYNTAKDKVIEIMAIEEDMQAE